MSLFFNTLVSSLFFSQAVQSLGSIAERKKAGVTKQKKYLEKNREKVNARRRAHYQKNEKRINAKRREQYLKKKAGCRV